MGGGQIFSSMGDGGHLSDLQPPSSYPKTTAQRNVTEVHQVSLPTLATGPSGELTEVVHADEELIKRQRPPSCSVARIIPALIVLYASVRFPRTVHESVSVR